MSTITSSEESSHVRRRRLRNGAITFAVVAIVAIGTVKAQSGKGSVPQIKPGVNTSFGPLKQIDAGLLNVGYVEAGHAEGPAVILLHGWPYDIHSYVDVTPLLASAGYRVIVPYLRGYGTTRFLSSETLRNGQQSAVAVDIINLMDALKIEKATIAGHNIGCEMMSVRAQVSRRPRNVRQVLGSSRPLRAAEFFHPLKKGMEEQIVLAFCLKQSDGWVSLWQPLLSIPTTTSRC
jgi:pimeloyl-ACP methyl ester carboxylesterase